MMSHAVTVPASMSSIPNWEMCWASLIAMANASGPSLNRWLGKPRSCSRSNCTAR